MPELWPSSRMGITVLTSLELQVKLTRKHFQIRIILIIFHTCLLCSSNHTVKIISIHQIFFFHLLSTNKAEQKKLKWVTLEKISSGLLWITLIITKNRYQYIFNIFFALSPLHSRVISCPLCKTNYSVGCFDYYLHVWQEPIPLISLEMKMLGIYRKGW